MAQLQASIPLTVTLRQETVAAFQAQYKDIPIAEWMATKCRLWLENFKDGGLMLSPDQVMKIEQDSGKPVNSGAEVVSAIGKTNDVADGQRTFLLTLDPTYVQPLIDRATEIGRTPTELVNDSWSWILDNNWLMSLDATYQPPVFFPNYKLIQTLTGKDRPTGAEIEKAITELVQIAKSAQKQTAE